MLKRKSYVGLIVIVVVFVLISLLVRHGKDKYDSGLVDVQSIQEEITHEGDEPPLKLKNIGVSFDDFVFTKEKLMFNRVFMPYGFVIPANVTSSGKSKANPQPTYIVPLGTPVISMVDGVVTSIPVLWSGDFSIHVTENGAQERWIYEIEHVINPRVKVGEIVKAGQVIAEVGSFGGGSPPGYGEVEIGILKGGNPPEHVCPYMHLDPSVREEVLSRIRDLYAAWEDYVGDVTLYRDDEPVSGCLTLENIPG